MRASSRKTRSARTRSASSARNSWTGRWLAHLYVFCKGGNSCCRRRGFHLYLAPLIDSHRARFAESITPIAAPPPLLRFLHQAPRHGIAVHVAQLLDPLALRPYVEIIESPLPHMLRAERK